MKVLITGVNGFIGKRLAEALLARDHRVIGIARQESPFSREIEYFRGDICDRNLVFSAMREIDCVIHLASPTAHDDIVKFTDRTREISLTGTQNVIEAMKVNNIQKLVFSSTGKVYGDVPEVPIRENMQPQPMNALGRIKFATEKYIQESSTELSNTFILRIFNVYGPGQKDNFVVPTILKQLVSASQASHAPKITLGDIEAKRDFIYIDDVVEMFVKSIEMENSPGGCKLLNVGSGYPTNVKDILLTMEELMGLKIEVNTDQSRFRSDEHSIEYCSFERARHLVGWTPRTNLKTGLKKTLESYGL